MNKGVGRLEGWCCWGGSGGGTLSGWQGKQTGSANKGMGGVMIVANMALLLPVILKNLELQPKQLFSKMSFINKIPLRM